VPLDETQPEDKLEHQRQFLATYSKTANYMLSCKAAGVTRQAVWLWKKNDKAFLEELEEARQEYLDYLEALALSKAKASDTMLIFILKANMPWKYGDRNTTYHELGNTFADLVRTVAQRRAERILPSGIPGESDKFLPSNPGGQPLGEADGDTQLGQGPPQDGGTKLHDGGQDGDSV